MPTDWNDAYDESGDRATLQLGTDDHNGRIRLTRPYIGPNSQGEQVTHHLWTVEIDGKHGNMTLGGGGADGDLKIMGSVVEPAIQMNGDAASVRIGTRSHDGTLELFNAANERTMRFIGRHGNIEVGGQGADGDIFVRNKNNQDTIHINGDAGDIIFHNADFAEEFDISPAHALSNNLPGSVMVLAEDGTLEPCTASHDSRVIGVVAGAEGYRPALILDRKGGPNRHPVAMVGKVMCRVCADAGAIRLGDLLTTSPRAGHAQRVTRRHDALGAVIGKALKPLEAGQGLIPVLVNLQ